MSRFLNVLRSWLVMVSIIAMGNTLQSFRDHTFLYEKLYTGKPNLGKKTGAARSVGVAGMAVMARVWGPTASCQHSGDLGKHRRHLPTPRSEATSQNTGCGFLNL